MFLLETIVTSNLIGQNNLNIQWKCFIQLGAGSVLWEGRVVACPGSWVFPGNSSLQFPPTSMTTYASIRTIESNLNKVVKTCVIIDVNKLSLNLNQSDALLFNDEQCSSRSFDVIILMRYWYNRNLMTGKLLNPEYNL